MLTHLLSAIYGGMVAGPNAVEYINGLDKASDAISSTYLIVMLKKNKKNGIRIMSMKW